MNQARGSPQARAQVHAQSVIACRLADLGDAQVREVEHQAVIDLDRAELTDDGFDPFWIRRTKPKEIRVTRGAVLLVEPMPEQHGALEQEVIPVARDRQPIQQALDGIAVQRELELLAGPLRMVQQSLADRIDAGGRGQAHATDSR